MTPMVVSSLMRLAALFREGQRGKPVHRRCLGAGRAVLPGLASPHGSWQFFGSEFSGQAGGGGWIVRRGIVGEMGVGTARDQLSCPMLALIKLVRPARGRPGQRRAGCAIFGRFSR